MVSRPGDVHYCIYHAPCRHAHYCVWFLGEAAEAFLSRWDVKGRIRLSGEYAERLPTLLQRVIETDDDPFLRVAAFMELLSLLSGDGCQTRKSEALPPLLEKMIAYVDQHLNTVEGSVELAQAFFISKSTVNRLFQRHVGITVSELILAKRLSLAEKLLRTDISVTDTCYRVGFSDCSRFIREFKKKFGVTPLKYKRELFSGG